MRWFWVDRFTEFVSGQYATSVKAVSLGEEQLHDHFPGYPIMPNSLIVEGLALTGGLLVSEANDFEERVILAKLARSRFHFDVVPGTLLTYRAKVEQIHEDGAIVTATAHVGEALQAEVEIVFAHVDEETAGGELFDWLDFLVWLKLWRLYEVGRKADGSRLQVPPKLAAAAATLADGPTAGRGQPDAGLDRP
jgi:3-hydroxyacyl-[acyl-carrier-protein] dehydratase